jgi:hypothetical protein
MTPTNAWKLTAAIVELGEIVRLTVPPLARCVYLVVTGGV